MKSPWAEFASGGRGPVEAVPVMLVHDGTVFGKLLADELHRGFEPLLGSGLLIRTFENAVDGVAAFFARGFRQSLPAPLWENQPFWSIWCLDLGDGAESSIPCDVIQRIDSVYPRKFRHIIIARATRDKIEEAVHLRDADGALERPWVRCFLPSSGESDGTTPELVAPGLSVYLRTAWERFCKKRDADLADALLLPAEQQVFTLGISSCGPDLEFHARRIGHQLAHDISSSMLLPATPQPAPEFDSLRETVSAYVIDSPVEAFEEIDAETGHGLSSREEAIHLEFHHGGRQRFERSRGQRDQWMLELRELRKNNEIETFLIRPAIEDRVKGQSESVEDKREVLAKEYLALPNAPQGFLAVIQERLDLLSDELDFATEIEAVAPEIPQDFAEDDRRVSRAIDAIPPRGAIWFRAMPFLVGFVWLALGPWLFGEKGNPLMDDDLIPVTITAIIAIFAIPVGLALRHLFVQARTMRRFATASVNVLARHLYGISSVIESRIRQSSTRLLDRYGRRGTAAGAQKELDEIRDCFRRIEKTDHPHKKGTNQSPFFSDIGVDSAIESHLEQWKIRAWEDFRLRLSEQAPSREKIWPGAEDWEFSLKEASLTSAREGLASLSFHEIVRFGAEDRTRRERLLHDHCEEANEFRIENHVSKTRRKIFIGPLEWRDYLGRHDDWEFHPSLGGSIHFLSVAPLVATNNPSTTPCSS